MYCMKCGKEIPEKQVFCDGCLKGMERFPVKPDTRVLLPSRPTPITAKKTPTRRKALSLEERLVKAKKAVQWLSIALVVSVIALFLSVSMLIDTVGSEDSNQVIGQNYSTVDS